MPHPPDTPAPTLVRPATADDVDRLVEVHLAARTEYYRDHLSPAALAESNATAAAGRVDLRRAVDDPDRLVLCAERDGRVVGLAHAGPPHHREADPAVSRELHQLHVDPAAFRSGAGTALMSAVLAAWTADGHRAGRLWVWPFNTRATAFYAARGWRPDGTHRPDTPPIDGTLMTGLRWDAGPGLSPTPTGRRLT